MPSEVKAQDTTSLASIKTVNEAAQSAKTAADTAFTNLSQVQSVLEVAQWIATHGTYVKATLFNPNATYYTITATQVTEPSDDDKDSQGVLIYYELDNGIYIRTTDTSVDEQKTYYRVTGTPVAQPDAEHIADYYTLAVSEAMADYVQSHLALTDEGLWIIPDTGGNKVLIATGSGSTYTTAGTYIIGRDNGSDVVLAEFTKSGVTLSTVDDNGNRVKIANLGYGSTVSESGLEKSPYYTLGVRASGSDIGSYSVAEGKDTEACRKYSHAEGYRSRTAGSASHAEGDSTEATGQGSHAEGNLTLASGAGSHAEGYSNHKSLTPRRSGITASGRGAHAEGSAASNSGWNIVAEGEGSHAEGYTDTTSGDIIARGKGSHAQNYGTRALSDHQTAIGRCNIPDANDIYALIIGNSTDHNNPSNALTVDWTGNVELALDTTAQSGDDHDIYTALQTLGWDNDVIV